MKNKIININKNLVKKKKFLEKELKKKIFLSIIQNLNLKPSVRSLSLKKISNFNLRSCKSKQSNNICLKTGKIKGVFTKINISRHEINKLSLTGNIQNFKINSW